jgi:hypothetical protein
LDLDMSENSFAIAESAGPLSCYDIQTGELLWQIQINKDGHFLKLCYNEELNIFLGVRWPFMSGGDKKIKYINKDNGSIEKELLINSPIETEFALNGQVLITSDREIINVQSGEKKSWV